MKLSFANHAAWSWRGRILLLALVAACLGWGLNAGAAVTFTASLDRDSMAVGDTATLSLQFEGGEPAGPPPVPDIPGLNIAYVGPVTQSSFVWNGSGMQNTSTTTHQYSVTAQRPGVFTIPAITVEVNGADYSSQPISLTVAKPLNNESQVAFVKLGLSRKQMYVGEVGTAELQIWLRDDVQNCVNLQLPSLQSDGFNLGKMTERARYRARMGDRTFTVIPIAITMTAIKSGLLTLGPLTAQMVLVLPSPNQGGDPFFRQFFNQGEQKQISLSTDAENIEGLKLPDNAPSGFTGAIGQFRMTVTEGPTTVSAGDPITLHVRIEGQGALDSLRLPDFSSWNGFKVYPPTTKTDYTDQQGLTGVKTFEQIVTPQNPEVHEIPAFAFTYFNPELQRYQSLAQAALPITVHSAGAMPVPSIAAAKPAGQENTAAQADILPVKQDLGPLFSTGTPLLVRPAFIALQSLPVLAFIAALIWRRRTDKLANNPRLRRQRQVAQQVQAGLADLRKFAAENQSEEFFAMLFRLLQEQLGACLDCPASAITEAAVDGRLQVSAGARTALRELFQSCNQARYAPVRDAQELAAVAAKFETVTRELQALKA